MRESESEVAVLKSMLEDQTREAEKYKRLYLEEKKKLEELKASLVSEDDS